MSKRANDIALFLAKAWPVLLAVITFFGSLWLSGKLQAQDIIRIDAEIAEVKQLGKEDSERLRNIERQVSEIHGLLKRSNR